MLCINVQQNFLLPPPLVNYSNLKLFKLLRTFECVYIPSVNTFLLDLWRVGIFDQTSQLKWWSLILILIVECQEILRPRSHLASSKRFLITSFDHEFFFLLFFSFALVNLIFGSLSWLPIYTLEIGTNHILVFHLVAPDGCSQPVVLVCLCMFAMEKDNCFQLHKETELI